MLPGRGTTKNQIRLPARLCSNTRSKRLTDGKHCSVSRELETVLAVLPGFALLYNESEVLTMEALMWRSSQSHQPQADR
jgi:hypothetical protein